MRAVPLFFGHLFVDSPWLGRLLILRVDVVLPIFSLRTASANCVVIFVHVDVFRFAVLVEHIKS